ncbi:MAG: ribulose-phosphate 3-epimerase [bacterium]|nr:ribulose-phosphate 3-epimerase [bacterium]
MNNIIVAPSILSADFANLERDIKKVEAAGADWIHIDVMDGHFVPNITIGVPVVKSIKNITKLPLDVHLMIENPEKYIEPFAQAGADILTFHYEAVKNPKEILQKIRLNGMKAGISIKPKTTPDVLDGLYDYIDLILVMTVEPGFGGQKFMEDCAEKLQHYKNLKNIYLEVDGGINAQTAKIAVTNGANALVAGNYIYNADDTQGAINSLK